MTIYRFTALMTISVFTEVEAETEEEARAIAEERSPLSMTNQPFAGGAEDGWMCDELDGEPCSITSAED